MRTARRTWTRLIKYWQTFPRSAYGNRVRPARDSRTGKASTCGGETGKWTAISSRIGYLGLFILLQIVSVSSLTHHRKSWPNLKDATGQLGPWSSTDRWTIFFQLYEVSPMGNWGIGGFHQWRPRKFQIFGSPPMDISSKTEHSLVCFIFLRQKT